MAVITVRNLDDEAAVSRETITVAEQPSFMLDYADLWRGADKIVYSTTLETVSSDRTRMGSDFDPEALRQLKTTADRDADAAR